MKIIIKIFFCTTSSKSRVHITLAVHLSSAQLVLQVSNRCTDTMTQESLKAFSAPPSSPFPFLPKSKEKSQGARTLPPPAPSASRTTPGYSRLRVMPYLKLP